MLFRYLERMRYKAILNVIKTVDELTRISKLQLSVGPILIKLFHKQIIYHVFRSDGINVRRMHYNETPIRRLSSMPKFSKSILV